LGSATGDRRYKLRAVSVVADRFDRAAFHRFFAETFFVRRLGLFINVRVAAIVVPLEIGGGGLATQIAVDALIIDVECARYVLWIFIRCVGPVFPEGEGGTLERKAPNAIICLLIDSDATATRRWHVSLQT
jgi:hypothetical protein